MKGNADQCYLSNSSNEESNVCIDNKNIKNSKCGKLFAVKIDQKLNFNAHINDICKKAGKKLRALSRVKPYMDIPKRRFSYVSIQSPPFSEDVP